MYRFLVITLKLTSVVLDLRDLGDMYFIPDYMAEFIQYAYYANRENEFETPSNVMIIDMGNISTTVSVFSCKKVVNVLFYEG